MIAEFFVYVVLAEICITTSYLNAISTVKFVRKLEAFV